LILILVLGVAVFTGSTPMHGPEVQFTPFPLQP
jgi:hypothetical protein